MISETMLSLPGRFQPKMAGNLQSTIRFNFTGTDDSVWGLSIGDGLCTVSQGAIADADATVTMAAADFIGINSGEIPAPDLFWGGQITIDGDVEAVIALAPVFGWQ